MKIEFKIREELSKTNDIDRIVKNILKFMVWDEIKLRSAINRHGTANDTQQSLIIKEFWGKKNE